MKKFFSILDKIFEIVTPIVFIAYGIGALIFSNSNFMQQNNILILEILLIIQGVATIADFIGGHKIRHGVNYDIVFGIVPIAMGIIFMARNMNLEHICLIWGIFEIAKGAFEIQHLVVLVHEKDYVATVEIVLAIVEIIFGILLCIHTEEDIKIHLIVVGIVFILSAAKQIFATVMEYKQKNKDINEEEK